MNVKVNWSRLSYRAVDALISVITASATWYIIDDRLAAALSMPALGHVPAVVIYVLFIAIRIATDTSGTPA